MAMATGPREEQIGQKYCGQRFGVAANVTLYEAPPYGGYAHVSLYGVAFSGSVSGMAWFSNFDDGAEDASKTIVMERGLKAALRTPRRQHPPSGRVRGSIGPSTSL